MRPMIAGGFARARRLGRGLLLATSACLAAPAGAAIIAPDNGSGTVTLPAVGTYYTSPADPLRIIDGLPAGTTVEISARLVSSGGSEVAGGDLGGHEQTWNPAVFELELTGAGSLAGFARSLNMPAVLVTTLSAPRTPGTSPQSFDTDAFMIQGQLPPGDPDFDLLRITAGTGFGLPSPGKTTLTDVGGGSWSVDSFFDITWRIDFIGKPGSVFDHPTFRLPSGSTTGISRFTLGAIPEPATSTLVALGLSALAALRRRSG